MSGIQETFLPSSSFIALTMPDQLCKRAGVFLLLPLFAKQIEYCLSLCFLGHALKKTTVAFDVLASHEPIHAGLRS
jgi:hypothetical protein